MVSHIGENVHQLPRASGSNLGNPPYAVNRPRTNSPLSPPFCGYSSFEAQADNALVVCVTRASLSFARFVPSLVLKLLLRKTFSALFIKVLVWW